MFERIQSLLNNGGEGGDPSILRDQLLFSGAASSFLFGFYLTAGNPPMAFLALSILVSLSFVVFLSALNKSRPIVWFFPLVWFIYVCLAVWFVGWPSGAQFMMFFVIAGIVSTRKICGLIKMSLLLAGVIIFTAIELYGPGLPAVAGLKFEWQNTFRIMHLILSVAGILVIINGLQKNEGVFESKVLELQRLLKDKETNDPLTGLLNRKAMLALLKNEVIRYERTESEFVIIMADMDDLTMINKMFGYEKGDEFLRQISDLIQSNLRKQDSCARWGGGDFLFLLPATDLEGGAILAEKLREEMVHLEIDLPESQNVSMTFGLGCYNGIGDEMNLLDEAREKMKKGKEQGGNRVIWE